MSNKEALITNVTTNLEKIKIHKEIAVSCDSKTIVLSLHDKVINYLLSVEKIALESDLSVNYINLFTNDINQIIAFFPYLNTHLTNEVIENEKLSLKANLISRIDAFESQVDKVEFNLSFFTKLNFFNSNIVAVGANGSGKTTLSNDLKKYLPNTGVVISAQKVMIIPTFSGVSNFQQTNQKLNQSQQLDKSLKVTFSTENNGNSWHIMNQIGGEFQILLDNLLAERSVLRNEFCESLQNGESPRELPVSKLDKALNIWNSLIEHRILECKDGINITLTDKTKSISYPAHQMSDGEKVTLYLIAHLLQAPESGFVIVDEPEMYLHKTILHKLWDILEKERKDCIFIYLTHDLEFATSRTTAKKVWIKSFTYPASWEIEEIPNNELPTPLLMELLGSRKDILFCEGQKSSIDEKIYNILFPNFTICPVESCLDVISYTKSFNKLPSTLTKAIGIVDSDHHSEDRLSKLTKHNIYSLKVSEVENLLLDESFLQVLSQQLLKEPTVVENIKNDVLVQLEKEIEMQASHYITSKINYYFNDSHVSKGNDLIALQNNYNKFTSKINISDWYDKRINDLNVIIKNKDYEKAISVFNNKGLKSIVNKHLKITDFTDRSIQLFQFESKTHKFLKKYFPEELTRKL